MQQQQAADGLQGHHIVKSYIVVGLPVQTSGFCLSLLQPALHTAQHHLQQGVLLS